MNLPETESKNSIGIGTIIVSVFSILLFSFAILSACLARWVFQTWRNLSMDELLFHLNAPLEGTSSIMIRECILECLLPALIVLIAFTILVIFMRRSAFLKWFLAFTMLLSLVIIGLTAGIAYKKLKIGDYFEAQSEDSLFIDSNYVSARDVTLTFPEKKRNLIYIFLESMEGSFSSVENGGYMKKDLIPELTEIAQNNFDFSGDDTGLNGGHVMPGSSWTIGAMFAQTAGIPLKANVGTNEMEKEEKFFNQAITLGDILKDAGYAQVLMVGSDAVFGGRRLYFSQHGDFEVLDHPYAIEKGWIDPDYMVWWGFEDEKLIEYAKNRITELAAEEDPFNFTMLTVDTHFEDGYICRLCQEESDVQYENVLSCSSRQIASFIKWIQEQDFYENTTIVISGDHLTGDKDYMAETDPSYDRRVYTAILNPGCELKNNQKRTYTTFDMFPTTLASLGVQIEGDQLGLGTNLFSGVQTLSERYGLEKEKLELQKGSKLMRELSDIHTEETIEYTDATADVACKLSKSGKKLNITVKKVKNVKYSINNISLKIWSEEDQSDLIWEIQDYVKDGTKFKIDLSSFKNKNLHIEAYAVLHTGKKFFLKETTY